MKKRVTKMPGKVGKVGRKKISESEKKIRIDIWQKNEDVNLLGGKHSVEELFKDFLQEKIIALTKNSPLT